MARRQGRALLPRIHGAPDPRRSWLRGIKMPVRCWVFDWPGVPYPKIVPGLQPLPLPDPYVLHPGRKWIYDGPSGRVFWILHESPFADDGSGDGPKPLMAASGLPALSDADVHAAIQAQWPEAKVVRAERLPAERYPRIWRGRFSRPTPAEIQAFIGADASANLLRERFRHVLMTIEPEPENRFAYGHELRQLLILASTEVESAWRAVLLANKYPVPGNGRFTTNQYCKLIDPLRLTEWEVDLAVSARYGTIAPFREWDPVDPTGSLTWYADHHAAKHDREVNLAKATLGNVISAMAALEVMLAAQMGPDGVPGSLGGSIFRLVRSPAWRLEEEYVPSLLGEETTLVPVAFSS